MIKRILMGFVVLLALFAVATLVSRRLALALSYLPLGWITYLERTIRETTLNWSGVGMGILCSLLILGLLHVFLAWLARQTQTQAAASSAKPLSAVVAWPWRRTLGIYAGLWLLFGVVIGASGLWRQSQWLAAIDPLYSIRPSPYADLKMAEGRMNVALLEAKGHWPEVRNVFLAQDKEPQAYGSSSWETFQVLYFPDTNDMVNAAVIVPRDERSRQTAGFMVIGDEFYAGFQPITNLAAVIAHLEKRHR